MRVLDPMKNVKKRKSRGEERGGRERGKRGEGKEKKEGGGEGKEEGRAEICTGKVI